MREITALAGRRSGKVDLINRHLWLWLAGDQWAGRLERYAEGGSSLRELACARMVDAALNFGARRPSALQANLNAVRASYLALRPSHLRPKQASLVVDVAEQHWCHAVCPEAKLCFALLAAHKPLPPLGPRACSRLPASAATAPRLTRPCLGPRCSRWLALVASDHDTEPPVSHSC